MDAATLPHSGLPSPLFFTQFFSVSQLRPAGICPILSPFSARHLGVCLVNVRHVMHKAVVNSAAARAGLPVSDGREEVPSIICYRPHNPPKPCSGTRGCCVSWGGIFLFCQASIHAGWQCLNSCLFAAPGMHAAQGSGVPACRSCLLARPFVH